MPTKSTEEKSLTFWEHLEVLRWTLLRILILLLLVFTALFTARDFLFTQIVFAPLSSDFWFYQALCRLAEWVAVPAFCPDAFKIQLINIQLTGQFLVHIGASFSFSLILIVPYILFEIWRFVQPALYPKERKQAGSIFFSASLLFYLGAATSYFVIFPLTVRFLGTYEVSALVPNQIAIQSYLGTLYILIFSLGILFEMPVLAVLLSRMGLIHKNTLRKVRSYAVVILLFLAALITPTTDPFTMVVVALPLYLLYELSILLVRNEPVSED